MFTHVNVLTREIIGAAIEVHRHLGPGLIRIGLSKLSNTRTAAEETFHLNVNARCR